MTELRHADELARDGPGTRLQVVGESLKEGPTLLFISISVREDSSINEARAFVALVARIAPDVAASTEWTSDRPLPPRQSRVENDNHVLRNCCTSLVSGETDVFRSANG